MKQTITPSGDDLELPLFPFVVITSLVMFGAGCSKSPSTSTATTNSQGVVKEVPMVTPQTHDVTSTNAGSNFYQY